MGLELGKSFQLIEITEPFKSNNNHMLEKF